MKKFYVFTKHPTYQLDEIVETEVQRDEKIRSWKQVYPDVPVFWIEVNEG
jgi:hypothetical protein